jgi:MSHA biogenesis protein MshO
VQLNDYAVIHNLGITGADAYNFTGNTNIKRITGFDFVSGATGITKESRITLANTPPATRYPLESPGRRYFVVSGPVTYACLNAGTTGGNGDGTLIRWSEYTYDPDHPTITTELANSGSPPASRPPGPLAGNLAVEAVLASNVSACEFTYTNNIAQQSRGLVSIRLAITRANETVVLYQQAHVNNVP